MTLTDLITRVEQGSGSDRKLDTDICVELQWGLDVTDGPIRRSDRHHECSITNGSHDYPNWCVTPHLTSSLDAIRALFKARLEGAWVEITDDSRPKNKCVVSIGSQVGKTLFVEVEHLDTYRAFLSATLKAIAAKEG